MERLLPQSMRWTRNAVGRGEDMKSMRRQNDPIQNILYLHMDTQTYVCCVHTSTLVFFVVARKELVPVKEIPCEFPIWSAASDGADTIFLIYRQEEKRMDRITFFREPIGTSDPALREKWEQIHLRTKFFFARSDEFEQFLEDQTGDIPVPKMEVTNKTSDISTILVRTCPYEALKITVGAQEPNVEKIDAENMYNRSIRFYTKTDLCKLKVMLTSSFVIFQDRDSKQSIILSTNDKDHKEGMKPPLLLDAWQRVIVTGEEYKDLVVFDAWLNRCVTVESFLMKLDLLEKNSKQDLFDHFLMTTNVKHFVDYFRKKIHKRLWSAVYLLADPDGSEIPILSEWPPSSHFKFTYNLETHYERDEEPCYFNDGGTCHRYKTWTTDLKVVPKIPPHSHMKLTYLFETRQICLHFKGQIVICNIVQKKEGQPMEFVPVARAESPFPLLTESHDSSFHRWIFLTTALWCQGKIDPDSLPLLGNSWKEDIQEKLEKKLSIVQKLLWNLKAKMGFGY